MYKKMILVGLFSFLFLLSGCTDQQSNQDMNNTDDVEDQKNTGLISLAEIALTENDFNNDMDMVFNNHTKEPYNVENLTGNDKKWFIQEGFFSSFACNTSRISQSILRFNTKDNATLNVQLNKQFLLDQGYSEFSINIIGNASFLLKSTKPFQDGVIDVWSINFSFNEIVVSLIGYASDKDDMIQYAETIENNIHLQILS